MKRLWTLSRAFISFEIWVAKSALSVYAHNISKSKAARITKLDTQMFEDEFSFILGQKIISRVTKTLLA